MDTLSPILLESERFTLTTNGGFFAINPVQFINPNKTPMLVDEVRFCGSGAGAGAFAPLLAKLSMGNSQLTNDYTPLPVLAPTYLTQNLDSTRVWHFPRPLIVPPWVQVNCQLGVKLPSSGFTIDSTTSWSVALAGRSLPSDFKMPRQIAIPWACSTSVYSTAVPFTSKDNELGNPFDSDFVMSQLIGYNSIDNNADLGTNVGSVTKAPLTIQATYGSGKMLIRDPVPFLALFPQVRPIARMRGLLKPKDFLKVVLDLPLPTATYTNMLFTSVGLVGYRMIDTPKGAAQW